MGESKGKIQAESREKQSEGEMTVENIHKGHDDKTKQRGKKP